MTKGEVLILVLMEDTLREVDHDDRRCLYLVLILVLMEDTLRAKNRRYWRDSQSLNPCFNGRYSQRRKHANVKVSLTSLNPCFNGRYSQSHQ